MNDILSLVHSSMQSDVARLDRVAMNLANAQTPGYKREIAITLPFAAHLERAAGEPAAASSDASSRGVLSVHADLRPGTLKATGQALDVALTGPGWFEVATDQGTAYTRQGNFRLDARARVVTQQGHPVMGVNGEIQLTHGAPVIDAAGRVFEDASARSNAAALPLAQFKVVQFEPEAPLERLGDGLVRVQGDPLATGVAGTEVRQAFVENSNVSSMQEMVQLLQSVRHMETMQKVALGYDEMLGASIRKLGDGV